MGWDQNCRIWKEGRETEGQVNGWREREEKMEYMSSSILKGSEWRQLGERVGRMGLEAGGGWKRNAHSRTPEISRQQVAKVGRSSLHKHAEVQKILVLYYQKI